MERTGRLFSGTLGRDQREVGNFNPMQLLEVNLTAGAGPSPSPPIALRAGRSAELKCSPGPLPAQADFTSISFLFRPSSYWEGTAVRQQEELPGAECELCEWGTGTAAVSSYS